MTAIKINNQAYGRLLAETLPAVIETEGENRRMIAIIDQMMAKPEMSPEESKLVVLLATLCQDFESKFYNVSEVFDAGRPEADRRVRTSSRSFTTSARASRRKEFYPT